MRCVTGANLFGQWLSNEIVLESFTDVFMHTNFDSKFNQSQVKLLLVTWSYNIFQIDDNFIVTGAWRGKDKQSTVLPLPEECTITSKLLLAGDDYNVIVIDVTTEVSWIFELKSGTYRRVTFNEVPLVKTDAQSNDTIIKAVVTNNSCIYLSAQGNVYMGLLPSYLDTSQCNGKVADIQCGYEHFMLLTDTGRVYTWGNGRRLQLGHGDLNNLDSPTEVEALAGIKIIKIRAGGWHSLALSESGDLYVWGWNDTGQLGIKTDNNKNSKIGGIEEIRTDFGIPTVIDIYDENETEIEINVKDIACGTKHSMIMLEDNSVWTAGNNKYGQLGFSREKYLKLDQFKKSFVGTDHSVLYCGPWCSIIDQYKLDS